MTDQEAEAEDIEDRLDKDTRSTRLTIARREKIRKLLLYQEYITFLLKRELL